MSYIYLSKAGLDGFRLANKLISNDETDSGNDNRTASLFNTIADVIGVDNNEIDLLTKPETLTVAGVEVAPQFLRAKHGLLRVQSLLI